MVGAVERVRPKMMTVVAIMAGLMPILGAWHRVRGNELHCRPDDRGNGVVDIPTLVVIPAVYALIKGRGLAKAGIKETESVPALSGVISAS